MTETYTLELNFEDAMGKAKKLTVKNPKANLPAATVEAAAQNIANANIFTGFDQAVSARYVRRTVEDIWTAQA